MPDYFRLLDVPRRPWLDPESVKEKFLARSTQVHPDRFHGAPIPDREEANRRFAELNAAFNTLREPRTRLAHLLELERGTAPARVDSISDDMVKLFTVIGGCCRKADAALAERRSLTSPVLRALWFQKAQGVIEEIDQLLKQLRDRQGELDQRLAAFNLVWERGAAADRGPSVDERVLGELEEIYRQYGFLSRWEQQLRERHVQLGLGT